MIIGEISDLHIDSNHKLYARQKKVLYQAVQEFANRKVDYIFVGGDLASLAPVHRLTTTERLDLAHWFGMLAEVATVILIRGNHDSTGESSLYSSIYDKFTKLNRIYYYESGFHFQELEAHGEKFSLFNIPYTPLRNYSVDLRSLSVEKATEKVIRIFQEYVKLNDDGARKIAFGHIPIPGAKIGGFSLSSIRDFCLPAEVFEDLGFTYATFGHIHERQTLNSVTHYIGSAFPTDFSENPPKGINIVTIDDKVTREFVELETWPMLTVTANWDKDWQSIEHNIKLNLLEDAYVHVILEKPSNIPVNLIPLGEEVLLPLMRKGAIIGKTSTRNIQPQIKASKKPKSIDIQGLISDKIDKSKNKEKLKELYEEIRS